MMLKPSLVVQGKTFVNRKKGLFFYLFLLICSTSYAYTNMFGCHPIKSSKNDSFSDHFTHGSSCIMYAFSDLD